MWSSLSILSLTHLEYSWSTIALEEECKGRTRKQEEENTKKRRGG